VNSGKFRAAASHLKVGAARSKSRRKSDRPLLLRDIRTRAGSRRTLVIFDEALFTTTAVVRRFTRSDLQCIDTADKDRLMGFWMKMQGRLGTFRFEHNGTIYGDCRFDSDTGPATGGSGPHNLTFPIKVLGAHG
jgi:hypothetical protein